MNPASFKVLLVDDDEEQLALRALLLQRAGFAVTCAADSSSALQLAAKQGPHCAVVDLRLPTEDAGLHLLRELKTLDTNIRLIVLTGANRDRLLSRPEAALVEEILTKPTASAALIELLGRLASHV